MIRVVALCCRGQEEEGPGVAWCGVYVGGISLVEGFCVWVRAGRPGISKGRQISRVAGSQRGAPE